MHGGHGYLAHKFPSPLSNLRTDEYGGSLEDRMRFALEPFTAMRAAWPADKPMGMSVSVTDWMNGGWAPDETVVLARKLNQLGCDYLDLSSGGLDSRARIRLAAGYQLPFPETVRKETGMTTMTVGLITEPAQAEEIVASGKADMVALHRGAMWYPRFAWHAAEALDAEAANAPKLMACHPKLRSQVFPGRRA